VLAKPSDQPNRTAQFLAERPERRLRLKAIAMSRSLWPPWIADWLIWPCEDGGKDEETEAKDTFFLIDA
jgi:hypothetical protein